MLISCAMAVRTERRGRRLRNTHAGGEQHSRSFGSTEWLRHVCVPLIQVVAEVVLRRAKHTRVCQMTEYRGRAVETGSTKRKLTLPQVRYCEQTQHHGVSIERPTMAMAFWFEG
jgi:hypothetical protein